MHCENACIDTRHVVWTCGKTQLEISSLMGGKRNHVFSCCNAALLSQSSAIWLS